MLVSVSANYSSRVKSRPLLVLAAISGLEGAVLAVYALLAIVNALTGGSFGPTEISNASAITLEIIIFAVLGAGLLFTAFGWLRARRWARAPFILMQLIAIGVGYNFWGSLIAPVILVLAIFGFVVALLPATTRELQ
mgnify:CR=1 FL=1